LSKPTPSRLLIRSGRPDTPKDRAAADTLAAALGYLPLALEQAAAFVRRVSYANWRTCERLAPHASACADHIAKHDLVSVEAGVLVGPAGTYHQARGDVAEAADPASVRPWWEKARETPAGMKARGMHISPQDDGLLAQLDAKLSARPTTPEPDN
jgi:hypothetical protein